ncbi:TetR/AcrR family transcriptional regulator C-terminal domain-containing protein [Clostridium sp. B9]|uniref:TetR/AcrR family transcriptional regulator C-terminal domain-containing protein n=1 Tax=Clostridium sp. B9 TaxID=3423224 RepID=UPI003D2F2062
MKSEAISKATKQLFANALKNKIKEKPIDKISVKEISEECRLNRRTFYRHFKDIYDLLEWICISELEDILKDSLDFEHWQVCLYKLLNYFHDNKEISNSIIRLSNRKLLEIFICNFSNTIILKVLNENNKDFNLSEKDEKFLCNFYSISFTGILIQWIENGMQESTEEITKSISKILKGSISRVTNI